MRKFILLLSFSLQTPLHLSAQWGHLEITRLLVESKADVAARDRCFSPPPSHHLSLTICLAAMARLHSNGPSSTTKPTSLHTCAASALLNDAPPRAAVARIKRLLFVWRRLLFPKPLTKTNRFDCARISWRERRRRQGHCSRGRWHGRWLACFGSSALRKGGKM